MSNCKRGSAATCGWLTILLLCAFLAGCGGSGGGGTAAAPAVALPGAPGAPGAAATNPTVGSASPSNGATNVATSINGSGNVVTGTRLTATFTQAMDPLTITPVGTFTLKVTNGANVPGTVTMNAANTIATFTPTAALTPNTSYTATVSTAAMSALPLHTAMPNTIAWSFTTNPVAVTVQAPVNLLTAGNFAILTQTGITNTGSHLSVITGNIGASPITAAAMSNVFCTEISGTIFGVDAAYVGSGAVTCFAGNPPAANKTLVDNAVADMGTAYTEAAGRTSIDVINELGAGDISGRTLAPGIYKWSTGLLIAADITLAGSANDVWIFQIAQDLTVSNGIHVNLAPGVQAKNIFWQVGGLTGVAIGTTAQIEGTILAQKAITLATGSVVNGGRLLSQTAVTLDATTVTQPAP